VTIIDVDLHFEVALGPDDHPLREYAERFPSPEGFVADAIAGDLARHTPEQSRPSETELAMFLPPENRASVDQCTRPGTTDASAYPFLGATVDERVAWLDSIGIDHAIVNPGGYGFLVGWLREDERVRGARLCNDYMADRLEGHTDRMMPVTLVDWSDLDDVVAELTRMRARGSRAFWLRAEPVDGKSPAHPDWDRVWSAATDLGMLAILHVGNTPARFEGGWGNAAWEQPGGTGLGGFFRYANSLRHQAAEMMLGAMLYGGVFGRHPNLTMLTEELNVAWLPYFVTRCEASTPRARGPSTCCLRRWSVAMCGRRRCPASATATC
jgi:predicted TIM-barrel fold metal-dependent hydrolase